MKSTKKENTVPWDELSDDEKANFAALCRRFVTLDDIGDAERYYGNKQRLIDDARAEAGR